MKESTQSAYQEIRSRLQTARKRENLAKLLKGALLWVGVVIGAFVLVLVAEGALYFDPAWRTILFWFLLILAAGLFILEVARPLLILAGILKGEDDLSTAQKLGSKFPSVRDHLLNALQLFTDARTHRYYSTEFIEAAFVDARKEIEPIDFSSATDFGASRRLGRIVAAIGLAGLLLFVLFPTSFFGSLNRLWHYNDSFAMPAAVRFFVEPGNREVIKGEEVRIVVRVEGEQQSRVVLSSRPEKQVPYDRVELAAGDDGAFRYEIRSLNLTTAYHAEAGSVKSDEYTLSVVDRPVVKLFRVNLSPPAYSGIGNLQLDDNVGDVAALKGTRIAFSVEGSKPLSEAALVFDDNQQMPMDVEGSVAHGDIRLTRETGYEFRLKDEGGLANTDPVRYSLKIVSDNPPRVSIEIPGANLDVAGNEQLNMQFHITDDYGFTNLRLAHQLIHSRYEQPAEKSTYVDVPIPRDVLTEGLVPFVWTLDGLHLVPEDVISYFVEVFDNDNVSGPKVGRSETFTLRLPSLEEVFANVDKGHDVTQESLQEVHSEAEQARKELEEIQQEMKKNQNKMDWQEKRKTEELVKKYEDIQKKIDDVSETMEQMLKEMQKNDLLSKETLEKYMEMQHLLEELNSPELAEALKRLQETLRQLDPDALTEAMKQLNFSEEQFRQNLERTINLLKRIQIEQKLDEAIKRTEELMKQQADLQQQTEQSDKQQGKSPDELSARQSDLKKQLDELRKEADELRKMMEEFASEMPVEKMDEALQQLDSSAVGEQMQQSSEDMKKQQMQKSMGKQQKALQSMSHFMDQLKGMQDEMRQDQQQQIVNELRKAYQDLLELSRREEDLKAETEGLEQNSPRFRNNSADQMEIGRDLGRIVERLAAIGQKSFGVTPQMGKAIGDAARMMDNSMRALEQRNPSEAGEQQGNAMASLNEAASQVQAAMNAMMQGAGQGMGMAGLMQQLRSITGMQQGINQGTQNLGGLSPQQAAEMSRLAGEQGMVRKSLEQLAREATPSGDLNKILGDLNNIASEMREVQTDLAQGNVQPETLRKQERILSRLLDSQRSMTERDYEKQRRAETGKEHARQNIPQTDLTTIRDLGKLRQDLLKAMEEGYAKDYESLIKKYFDLLESQEGPQ